MHWKSSLAALCASSTFVAGKSVVSREVAELDQAAFEEAQQRDDTATRAFSNIQIQTSDGRCLSVDKFSGDFRANLTPVQVADCGSEEGQGWDIITSGKHNDQPGQMLVVSTLTQACLSFDPRRDPETQVHLFSCGGRADGEGEVSNSQLFAFRSKSVVLSLAPQNEEGTCFTGEGETLSSAACNGDAPDQIFSFGDNNSGSTSNTDNGNDDANAPQGKPEDLYVVSSSTAHKLVARYMKTDHPLMMTQPATCKPPKTVTVMETVTVTADPMKASMPPGTYVYTYSKYMTVTYQKTTTETAAAMTTAEDVTQTTYKTEAAGTTTEAAYSMVTAPPGEIPTENPTEPVPISRDGNELDPKAAAEANQFDDTAKRDVESVNIRAKDGRCLSIDPTAGDFRENLIPVALADCNEDPNQKFDIVTKGKHDDGKAKEALVVSVLMNGCLNFDKNAADGDTVTMFSCGGRADGSGETNNNQLFPFDGTDKIVLEPKGSNGEFCFVAGKDRLESAGCNKAKDQIFDIVEVL